MTIIELQKALAKAGFDPGPIDGIAGPLTRTAIRAFQKANGLEVDGIAGPKTIAKLTGAKKLDKKPLAEMLSGGDVPTAMPWMAEAMRLVGVTEVAGSGDNPEIMGWADAAHIPYDRDETPWCGLFVAHCVTATLPDEPLPKNPLGARQWLKFGVDVPPQVGAVLVFWRGSVDGWQGHTGFYWAEDATHFHVLGGNQGNAVSIVRVAKSRCLGARWPRSVAPLGFVNKVVKTAASVSVNEE